MRFTMPGNAKNRALPGRALRGLSPIAAAVGVTLALSAGPALSDPEESLQIRADSATVKVSPDDGGRRSLPLPALEYVVEIDFQCQPAEQPGSLSLTIADTRQTLAGPELADAGGTATVTIEVPASQLPPLVFSDFCSTEDAANGLWISEKRLGGILSASASLRCDAETNSQASYATAPLDVTLVCEAQASDETSE